MKKKLKKYGKGGSTIKDPRQDPYYTPSSSDKKIVENIKKEEDIKTRSRGTISNPVNLQEFTITAPRQTDPNKKAFGTVYPDTTPPSSELASTLFMTPLSEYVHTPSRVVNYGVGAIKNKTFNFNPYQSELSKTLGLEHRTDVNDSLYEGVRDFFVDYGADMLFPMSPKTPKQAGTLFREQVYKAIDPVGYGAKEKILSSPKTWWKNTVYPEKRALDVGKELSNLNPKYYANELERIGQNRLDAWRVGLKLDQKWNTFEQIGDNTYRIKNMSPEPGEFSSVYSDMLANQVKNESSGFYTGENPLVTIAKKHDKVSSPKISTKYGDYSINDMRRYLMKEGDNIKPWEQYRIVENAKNPEFQKSVYDADRQGIMGSFRWDIKKPTYPNYNIHFQSNDLWNLNPFEKRGAVLLDPSKEEQLTKHFFKPLQNLEALELVGGKPFNIQNNFIVDPKTYQIKKSFKQGGKIKTDPNGKRYGNKDWSWSTSTQIPINQGNIYKKDWLMGYKPVEFEEGGEIINQNIQEMKKGGKIHIKESKKGTLHTALGVPQDEKIPASKLKIKESDSPALKKKKQFAINSKKWHHAENGLNLIDEPTFGVGDEGFMQQNLPFNKNLDFQVDIKNPYEFNPSLTKSLQDYTGNKPQLNQEEQKIYNQYNSNPQNLQGLNQLQNQSIQLPPSTFNITGSKYWTKMNDKLNKAQDQAVKAGEAVVSGFTGGMGGKGKGFMKNGGQLPKAFAGSFIQWGNAAAHSASALGNLGGSMIAGTQALLDTIGTNNINNFVKKTEADRLKQGIYSGAENQPPYENYGYGWQGRNNALAENGKQIKEIGGKGMPNIEVEGGGLPNKKGEHIILNNGFSEGIKGATHEQGGIKQNYDIGTRITSDNLSLTVKELQKLKDSSEFEFLQFIKIPKKGKMTFAEMSRPYETKKEFNILDSKFSDDIARNSAQLMINKKNELGIQPHQLQENLKRNGFFGNKIQNEAINDLYMEYGGMAKAGNGKSLRGTGKDVENNFKNLDEVYENYKKHGYKGKKDITELREWSYNKNPQEVSAYIERSRPTNAHKKIWEEKYSTTEPVDISKMSPEDRFAGYNDKLWDYRAYKFQDTPKNTAFATETVKTSDKVNPINAKFKGQGFDFGQFKPSSLNLNLPKTYERSPVNVKFIDPNYIDPRYLDINPQLNEINRGVNAIQMNLGDRSANSIGNLLQAQANAYNAKNQVFNQKYNYDRGQDSQAQQFNAQAKFNADVTNLGEFNRFQELIGRREGAIQAQKDFDYNAALQNQMEQEKYAQQQELIKQMFNPSASAQGNPFTFNTPKKNGGKIKTKLKPKKSLK